jgi:hypothetical protein
MNIMRFQCLLMILFVAAVSIDAQSLSAATVTSTKKVYNEDRGRACVLINNDNPTMARSAELQTGPVQFSIFYGSGWSSDALRTREPGLANLLLASYRDEPSDQGRLGLASGLALNNYLEISAENISRGNISDLKIQAFLRDYLLQGSRSGSDQERTIIVYLDPTVGSTLSEMTGGRHYLAYHNEFNVSGKKVRYVVVPFEEDVVIHSQTALNAFLSAIYDPTCSS